MKISDIIKSEKHNSYCKLIEIRLTYDRGYMLLVYGIENDGTNEGLEIYYHKVDDKVGNFFTSRRWIGNKIPIKHKKTFNYLKSFVDHCLPGHKIIVK